MTITLSLLRKIGADHASRIHRGKNDSGHQYLWDLATRHKRECILSIQHYGAMNDKSIFLFYK